jgi:hypothetical protein
MISLAPLGVTIQIIIISSEKVTEFEREGKGFWSLSSGSGSA